MKLTYFVVFFIAVLVFNGCKKDDNSIVNPPQVSGKFRVDSVQLTVNQTRTTFNFILHFTEQPGDCNLFKIDVGYNGYAIAGGPTLGFSPFPIDSLIHLSATFNMYDTLAIGDSVWAVYQFRGEFWDKVGSTRLTYGEFTSRDSVKVRVEP